MLTYVLFCFLVIVQSTVGIEEPTLNYTCDHDGVATIKADNLSRTYILVNETTHVYCKPTSLNLHNCYPDHVNGTIQRPKILKVLYELEVNPKIVGGKQPYYFNLTCVDGPRNLTASAQFNQTKFNETYHSKAENATWKPTEHLSLLISTDSDGNKIINTDVEIGQDLYLVMTVPGNFKISPEKCDAKPTGGKDEDIIKMWEVTDDDSCNDRDEALVEKQWSVKNEKLVMKMYGFRFRNSQSVTVTCTALVCPGAVGSLCKQICVSKKTTQRRRRRNAIEKSMYSKKSASVSFHVGTTVETNGATGVTPTFVVFTSVLFCLMNWVERYMPSFLSLCNRYTFHCDS